MFIASLLFGISASLDALLVGVSYGIRRVRIRLWQNLLISLITLLGTCLSVEAGEWLGAFLPEAVSSRIGSFILISLGIYYIAKFVTALLRTRRRTFIQKCKTSELASVSVKECPSRLKLAEVFTLSVMLSLNNLSAGISASLAGLTLIPAAISTLFCSVLFLSAGNRLGGSPVLQFAGRAADPISGILLVGLGLVQLFL